MEMQKLEENATFNLNKKKGIVAERKEAKIEIDEAERYKKLQNELVSVRVLLIGLSLLEISLLVVWFKWFNWLWTE